MLRTLGRNFNIWRQLTRTVASTWNRSLRVAHERTEAFQEMETLYMTVRRERGQLLTHRDKRVCNVHMTALTYNVKSAEKDNT